MLIAETEYKHQVEEDIQPFRDVLLGLFFITIGMLLNVPLVLQNWWLVLLLLAVTALDRQRVSADLLVDAGLAKPFELVELYAVYAVVARWIDGAAGTCVEGERVEEQTEQGASR